MIDEVWEGKPEVPGRVYFDWGEVAKVVSAISPVHHLVAKPGSALDSMTDNWSRSIVEDNYSEFVALMHSLDLAVHMWRF
jgi:hypothetical protein